MRTFTFLMPTTLSSVEWKPSANLSEMLVGRGQE